MLPAYSPQRVARLGREPGALPTGWMGCVQLPQLSRARHPPTLLPKNLRTLPDLPQCPVRSQRNDVVTRTRGKSQRAWEDARVVCNFADGVEVLSKALLHSRRVLMMAEIPDPAGLDSGRKRICLIKSAVLLTSDTTAKCPKCGQKQSQKL
jgi:hypothetical protein